MKGYILNGTYDIHREINAKVIGVLKHNNDIRKELLERNIGFYNLLNPDDGIGYISNFYSNISSKPFSFDKNGLLGYTHYMTEQPITEYQKYIQNKYDFGDVKYYYNNGSLPDNSALRWNNEYRDYRDYISEITDMSLTPLKLLSEFFKDKKLTNPIRESGLTIQSVLNDFIQYDNIKYAMEKNSIGTVNPNPLAALLGAVTTNISNFSGKDTTLGLITNQLYANTLRSGAIFNSLRKTQYITPEVYDKLGNKLSTIATLGADFRIDDETGRLAYDLGKDFNGTYNLEDKSLTEWIDIVNSIDKTKDKFDNEHARLKNLSYNDIIYGYKNGYLPFENSSYAKFNLDAQKIIKPRLNYAVKSDIFWFEGVNKYHALYRENDDNNINSIITDNNSLLKKTHNLFKRHDDKGIDTLIGRYYTTGGRDTTHNEISLFQSAVDKTFGMSHGRNLLKKEDKHNKTDIKGYINPYCRVWTNSNRYDEINKLIRPFVDDKGNILDINAIQNPLKEHIRTEKGVDFLNDKSVLNKNGFVNITPYKIGHGSSEITKCMFSIENLAWKDYGNENNLSEEQIGPNGGRIMWFPPYDLKFNENINVNWSSNDFIGRGERIYSYTNTDRSGTLSFILLVDNPSILSEWKEYGEKEETPEEQEQQLLRFFAGCEPLKLRERGYNEVSEYNEEVEYTEDEVVYTPYTPKVDYIDKDIVFYIFFPNNYSGIDDDFDDALDYLINDYDNMRYNNIIYEELPWRYRVDKKYRNQKLNDAANYEDKNQYNINTDLNFSFLLGDNKKHFEELYSDVTCSLKEIKDNFKNILYNKIIYKVILESETTNIGYEVSNKELARNRMNFGKKFIKNVLSLHNVNIIAGDNNIKINSLDNISSSNISSLKSKLSRCVKITLKSKEIIPKNMTDIFNNILVKKFPDVKENIENQIQDIFSQSKIYDILNEQEETLDGINKMWRNVKYVNTEIKKVTKTKTITITDEKYVKEEPHRSDEEYKYFEMLESYDKFSYNKLVDKIKYFSPAFHSITPEGFNSRLSFLHQCTRQGPTLSVSDKDNEFKSAGNLAFGRPPICVLRIGDFYHTRIVIESLSIDFNDSGWDMNPEGIGVQPMFARISINFKFLGGSDLYAPISRLQNALSFNYYANQGVYDNRSDKGKYTNEKNVIDGTPWTPK